MRKCVALGSHGNPTMSVSIRSPRISTLIDDDCDDIECDLMLDALQHHLDQVEVRI